MALGAVEHHRQTSMHCVQGPKPVDARHLFCKLERDLGERAVVSDPCIGDQQIDPACLLYELGDHALNLNAITNVTRKNQMLTGQRLSKLTQRILAAGNQAKLCSTRSELLAKRFADALGGSGHNNASIRPDLHLLEVK